MTGSPEPHPLLAGRRSAADRSRRSGLLGQGLPRPAAFDLQWNNPKIHTPDRRKHWLACAEHRESLSSFLSPRGFLRDVEDLPDASG